MPKFDWKSVTRNDVLKAIKFFLKDNPEYPSPRSTFLIYEGMKLPAKHIRGMAYKVAHNQEMSKEDYAGGMETVRFFERLGFEMFYTGTSSGNTKALLSGNHGEDIKKSFSDGNESDTQNAVIEPMTNAAANADKKIRISSKKVIDQKNALQLILNKMFGGDIVCEKTFPWLKTPENMTDEYADLFKELSEYRGYTDFAKKNVVLRCDFVCESQKLIIEYDERQHFSEARRRSLQSYKNIPTLFDRNLWMKACADIQAKDGNPANRDEVRAYYDSTRDIEAYKHGYRLVRIMHGQIDFEEDDADEKLKKLVEEVIEIQSEEQLTLETKKKINLKIAMYLQAEQWRNKKDFDTAMSVVKKSDIDILVFPETGWTPFEDILEQSDVADEADINKIFDRCEEFSRELGCAVVVSSCDKYNTLYSIFANVFAPKGETRCQLYIKHTMTNFSAFDFENYTSDWANALFTPIHFKGYSIGLTICYDCNHSLFSRMYGVQGVDIILNSTGGDVVYDKWYKYNQSLAIENKCYTFVTMGGDGKKEKINSYVYGFNRRGKALSPHLLNGKSSAANMPGGIYLFDLMEDDNGEEIERGIFQKETINKKGDYRIPVGNIDSILEKSKKLDDKLFVYHYQNKNIVFCVVQNEDIFRAEKFLPQIYSSKLEFYNNRRYVLVSKFRDLTRELYENQLSVVLKVRAMENYCAVILESNLKNNCYQTGMNRTAQLVKPENGFFELDLSRMSGPEAIWKDKIGMRASWRTNFTWLANECKRLADSNYIE